MKKNYIILAFSIAILLAGCGKVQKVPEDVTFDAKEEAKMSEEGDEEDVIGEAEAVRLAVANTGQKEEDVTVLETRLDEEKERKVYKVAFKDQKMKYEYTVDAYSGNIISFSSENSD